MNLVNTELASARRTIRNLIFTHQQTLRDIEGGKKFFKDGADITVDIYERAKYEIKQCQMVDDALDYMKAGYIRRAAALCEQISERILNVQ